MQTVLVIESDLEVRRHVSEALESSGYSVLTAADAHQGLRLLQGEPIAIVLVDLHALETDALHLIRQLHRTRLSAKIIIMTHDIEDWPNLAAASNLGARMFIQKPFNRQKLLEIVREQLPS